MVRKCAVLFRVQYFQQGAGRIPAVIFGQLVHFIQHHDRIGRTAPLHGFHDPSRHGADVSPAVSADLRLVPDAAQADAGVFAPQRPCNALTDAGLAGAGGAYEEQDGTVLLPVQRHDSQLLDDALFYFLQPVMIFIQDLLGPFQIDGGVGGRLP